MKPILLLLLTFFLLFNPSPVNAVTILMYHYVGNNPNPADTFRNYLSVTPEQFDQQMAYLKNNNYTPITFDTYYSKNYPTKSVILTFDDGYTDFYYNAYPILKKYNFHVVAFIPTRLMSQGYYLTWDQVRQMRDLVSFQSHGATHKEFTSLNFFELNKELKESKKSLEKETGQIVNFVAYPEGKNDFISRWMLKLVGYVDGIGTKNRVAINQFTTMPQFANLVR